MKTDLLRFVEQGGCSSKIPAKLLEEVLKHLPFPSDPNILVGIETHDDAAVYRVSDDLALVLTTDFFPPVCSDPYEFGQIAAANSLSDVYAMGGEPKVALNIMMFPAASLPMDAYAAILRGGYDKALEAGVKIIGGHTIDDPSPKYGLAVTGFVHPQRIITNAGCRVGDLLVLTKPVGTGIINAGLKMGIASDEDVAESLTQMKILNKAGCDVMRKYRVQGATDITGFGLGGHALKMAKAGNVTLTLEMQKVPLIGNVYRLTDDGCIPGASFRNLEYAEDSLEVSGDLDYNLKMIAFDAQTSGGLLMSVPEESAESLLTDLHSAGMKYATIIGSVTEPGEKRIRLI